MDRMLDRIDDIERDVGRYAKAGSGGSGSGGSDERGIAGEFNKLDLHVRLGVIGVVLTVLWLWYSKPGIVLVSTSQDPNSPKVISGGRVGLVGLMVGAAVGFVASPSFKRLIKR